MQSIYQKSLADIFSKNVLFFVVKITTLSGLTAGIFLWYFWEGLSSFILSYLSWIPWEWLQTSGATTLSFAIAYILFTIMLSIFTSLYSEALLIKLAKKHYPNTPVISSPEIIKSLLISLKASGIFFMLFILFLPLLFIPIFGQIVLVYLWSIMLRKPTIYDVGTLFISDKTILKQRAKKTRILAMIASLFNYIPLLNFFAPVFGQILFLHHILLSKSDEN